MSTCSAWVGSILVVRLRNLDYTIVAHNEVIMRAVRECWLCDPQTGLDFQKMDEIREDHNFVPSHFNVLQWDNDRKSNPAALLQLCGTGPINTSLK